VALAGVIAAVLLGPAAPAAAAQRSASPTAGRPAAAPPWRRPVTGSVERRFAYDRGRPFARGARRGVDLRAAAGAPVRAPCSGRVTHAGPVPGRRRGVTVRCGPLRATVLGLATTAVHRGARVHAGARIGTAAGPTLRLGARAATDRFGYVDPLRLLAADGPHGVTPHGVPPLGRAPRAPRALPPHAARPVRTQPPHAARPVRAPHAAPQRAPLAALLGIALLTAATGVGRLVTRSSAPRPAVRTRRRAAPPRENV